MFKCQHIGCTNNNKLALGFCSKHYWQFKRHGRTFEVTRYDFNEIVHKGDYYELILTNNKMEETGRAKIDLEDLEKVKAIGRWYLHDGGYVSNRSKDSAPIYMHRLIMNAKGKEDVDHKKVGIKYKSDNRKKNLRISTRTQNMWNKEIGSSNKSGFKGVSRKRNKWSARIVLDGKPKYLGTFSTPEEAAKAYNKAAKAHHKDYYNDSTRRN